MTDSDMIIGYVGNHAGDIVVMDTWSSGQQAPTMDSYFSEQKKKQTSGTDEYFYLLCSIYIPVYLRQMEIKAEVTTPLLESRQLSYEGSW